MHRFNSAAHFIYRAINKFIPLDLFHVYVHAEPEALAVSSSTHNELQDKQVRIMSPAAINALASVKEFSISEQFLSDIATYNIECVGIYSSNRVVGLCCFTSGDIPAHMNCGGSDFRGIALEVPPGSCYLFKVIVLPEFRGKRLLYTMLDYAIHGDGSAGSLVSGRTLVTTSDIANRAFRKAALRSGFRIVDSALEVVILKKHFFKIPKPIFLKPNCARILFKKPVEQ